MTSNQTDRPVLGIALVTMAVMCFAIGDSAMKHLAMRYPVPMVQTLRYALMLAILVFLFAPSRGRSLWTTRRTGLVVLRGMVLATGSLVMGLALGLLPVGETVAIGYASPLLVLLLSAPLLGERVNRTGWIGAALGFAGVMLIIRPNAGLDPTGVTFAILYALISASYTLLSRLLTRTETTLSLLFFVALVGTLVFTTLTWATGSWVWPSTPDLGIVALLSIALMIGHFLFTAAYRAASPALLSPFSYLHLVFAGALGWGVFGHLPDLLSLVGMALILASGLGLALLAQAKSRKIDREPLRTTAGNAP